MAERRVIVALRSVAWARALPRVERLATRVVRAVLGDAHIGPLRRAEVGVILADDSFVRRLNRDHRGKDAPTNVLAFPLAAPRRGAGPPVLLGDVVLAFRTVHHEARAQGKRLDRHIAHLLVHGTLHLLGYDHERPRAAREMERHEVRILAGLGVPDPYAVAAGGSGAP